MGIEAFIIPWIVANLFVGIVGSRSTFHDIRRNEAKFGAISIAGRASNPSGFWASVALKGVVSLSALWLAYLAARPVWESNF